MHYDAAECVSVSSGRKHVSALMITQDPRFLYQELITPFFEFVQTSSGRTWFQSAKKPLKSVLLMDLEGKCMRQKENDSSRPMGLYQIRFPWYFYLKCSGPHGKNRECKYAKVMRYEAVLEQGGSTCSRGKVSHACSPGTREAGKIRHNTLSYLKAGQLKG